MIRKLLLEILDNQRKILKLLDTKTVEKAKKYDEIKETMKDVKIPVKKTAVAIGSDGMPQVTVTYEQIVEVVEVDSEGNTQSSAMFKAMNLLNLVPYSDMRKISGAIEEARKK